MSTTNKTRCKPGDRARVIRAVNPQNINATVVVVRHYSMNELIDGSPWMDSPNPWVVVGLTGLIAGAVNGNKPDFGRTAVMDDSQLQPLDDEDAGTTKTATRKTPKCEGTTT